MSRQPSSQKDFKAIHSRNSFILNWCLPDPELSFRRGGVYPNSKILAWRQAAIMNSIFTDRRQHGWQDQGTWPGQRELLQAVTGEVIATLASMNRSLGKTDQPVFLNQPLLPIGRSEQLLQKIMDADMKWKIRSETMVPAPWHRHPFYTGRASRQQLLIPHPEIQKYRRFALEPL